ncbi:MAG: chemotaxis protein CheD [Calditrichia bacterium]
MKQATQLMTDTVPKIFLYPGELFVGETPHLVTTVLGSCIAVCLWDPKLQIGGINHYLLPLWNGEGLPSPRYGNIAIPKLIEKMLAAGADRRRLQAKLFGGAAVVGSTSAKLNVGERNIDFAKRNLELERISISGASVGENFSRKILFDTQTGKVLLKKVEISQLQQ